MFVIEVPYINLDHIYNSGQAPRWIKLKDSHYIIPYKNKALKIQQQKNRFDFNRHRLIMNCSEEDFYNIWFNYLDLRTDYFKLNMQIKRLGGKFKVIANRGSGIHILNQDPFEAYIFGKLIKNIGWVKAKELMNRIAQTYGIEHKQSMREAGRVVWYEWPNPEIMLEKLNREKESSGKIKPLLRRICENIVDRVFDIEESNDELFRLLGMHKNVFPIIGIEETLEKNFDCIPEEFEDWYLYGFENKGLIYMYILHHIMNPPKKIKEAISNGVNR